MTERFPLSRFVCAQDDGKTYERALAELHAGRKSSHWMWFILPQIRGLGESAMSKTYAVASIEEARAYLAHPVLGPRLIACTQAIAESTCASAQELLGTVDARKLCSSMTLFAHAAPGNPLFREVLEKYFGDAPDPATELHLRDPAPRFL